MATHRVIGHLAPDGAVELVRIDIDTHTSVEPAAWSWDRPWDTKCVLPGLSVSSGPWGVPTVLVERDEHFHGALDA